MKKIGLILILTIAVTFNSFAQKKGKKHYKEAFTVEQQTILKVKKMTLHLDLSKNQQNRIKPLIQKQIETKRVLKEQRKQAKRDKNKLSKEERFRMMSEKLDKQIAFKQEMKNILNEKQYEKFERSMLKRTQKIRKKLEKRRKKMSKRKNRKE